MISTEATRFVAERPSRPCCRINNVACLSQCAGMTADEFCKAPPTANAKMVCEREMGSKGMYYVLPIKSLFITIIH